MAAQLFFLPFRAATVNGIAQPGAKLYFYSSGTTTPRPSYTTSALNTPHAHPVVANAVGAFPAVYLDSAISYRLIIKNRSGTTLADIDPFVPGVAADASLLQPFVSQAQAAAAAADASQSTATTQAGLATAARAGAETAEDGAQSAYASTLEAIADNGGVLSSVIVSVASRAALAGMSTASGLPVFLDGNVWALHNYADHSALVTADTAQGLAVRSTFDTSKAWLRQYGGQPVNPQWFGVVQGSGVSSGTRTANNAAWTAMASALGAVAANTDIYNNRGVPEIRFGLGTFEFSAPLELNFGCVIISGQGSGISGAGSQTALKFYNSTGIRIQDGNTTGATAKTPGQISASSSIVRDLSVHGNYAGGAEAEYHGVHARTSFLLHNVHIVGFAGDGCRISANNAGAEGGNANNWEIRGGRFWGCRVGLSVGIPTHYDTSAGNAYGLRCDLNRQAGIWEGSFLGNTYHGCHQATNGWGGDGVTVPETVVSHSGNNFVVIQGEETWCSTNSPPATATSNQGWHYIGPGSGETAWFSGILCRAGGAIIEQYPNSYNVYTGNYIEQDQLKCQLSINSIMVGGIGTDWIYQINNSGGGGAYINGGAGNGGVKIGPYLTNVSHKGIVTSFGGDTSNEVFASTYAAGGYNHAFNFRWHWGKNVAFGFDGSDFGEAGFVLSHQSEWAMGRSINPAKGLCITNGLYVGSYADSREIGMGTAPTATPHGRGDIKINREPNASGAGSNAGWKAHAGGSVTGDWSQFGGTAAVQADTAGGATLATLISDHNALLAKLRAAGLMAT